MKIIEAKPFLEKNLTILKHEVDKLNEKGIIPHLKVVLVGNNPSSLSYIKNKEKCCLEVGASFTLVPLEANISREKFLNELQKLNNDKECTGYIVQLPLPSHLKDLDLGSLISPSKDVDGFSHLSTVSYVQNKNNNYFIPCTPKGIIKLLEFNNIKIAGSHIVIIGRSLIVGKPLFHLLTNKDATVTLCHTKTEDLRRFTKIADIIICATGSPHFFDESYLNPNLKQTIIDVGISKDQDGHIVGDTLYNSLKDKVYAITPVPGGIGPMTVYSLIENLIEGAK